MRRCLVVGTDVRFGVRFAVPGGLPGRLRGGYVRDVRDYGDL